MVSDARAVATTTPRSRGIGAGVWGKDWLPFASLRFTQMTRAARTRSNLKFWVVLMLLAECMSVCCDDEWCLRDVSYPHVESPDYTLQFQPQQSITPRVNRRGSFLTFSSFQHKLHESVLLARPGMYKTRSSRGRSLIVCVSFSKKGFLARQNV